MISRVVDRNWRLEFEDALELDADELMIVSPFIKSGALVRLIAKPPKRIRVVTRFNLEDFAQGVSDIDALRKLLDAGALVRGVRNLHAKLYVFGRSRAIVTSANLTKAGMDRNHELGVVTGEEGVVAACREYFERLWVHVGHDLTVAELEKWDAEIIGRLAGGGRVAAPYGLGDHGADIGLSETPEHPTPSVFEDRPQAFVKFLGMSKDRAPLSGTVMEELKESGCHWALGYPAKRRPRSVRDGAVMFVARLVEGPDIRVFGRGIGLAHRPGRDDATQADIQLREWKSVWPRYVRVHDTEFVDGTLANGVSLGELMDSLGSRCFASTASHAQTGQGNTNPRRAIRQQSAMELTQEGVEWLSQKLERSFEVHGQIQETTLNSLDWPVVASNKEEVNRD